MYIISLLRKIPFLRRLKDKLKAQKKDILGWLSSKKHPRLAKRIARAANAKERPIKVAFIMYELAFWKNEALYTAMQADERFTPAFWLLNPFYIADETIRHDVRNQCIDYIQKNNFPYYDNLTLEELRIAFAPDYIFAVQPYAHNIPFEIYNLRNELPCFIPYGYSNMHTGLVYNDKKIRYFFRYYVESEYIQNEARKYMANKARNTRVTGLPMATWLLNAKSRRNDNRKCIIWAPHWTIGQDNTRALNISTFLTIADEMLNIVNTYKEQISFVFKPHPRLKRELYTTDNWGAERTDAYYRSWQDGENTRLEDGDYTALFAESDAMIHDCGSFILEYLLMNKPCMYMLRAGAHTPFNQSTQQALECYQKGTTPQDIENFIQDVLAGNDSMTEKREAFIHSYLLPNNQSPVQNIISDLLNP